jgi:hypothetical protein
MNNPDLFEKFCHPTRQGIEQPFSVGEWTYATNGHICLRVPRRDDIAENPAAPDPSSLFNLRPLKYKKRREYKPAPQFDLVEPFEWNEKSQCFYCRGTGKAHVEHCPSCACKCLRCNSAGKLTILNFRRAALASPADPWARTYNAKYLSWLQSLPNLESGLSRRRYDPLPFRFAGGEGLLMPRQVFPQA